LVVESFDLVEHDKALSWCSPKYTIHGSIWGPGTWRGLVSKHSISQRSEKAALRCLDLTAAATMQHSSPTSGPVSSKSIYSVNLTSWLPDEERIEFRGALLAGREAFADMRSTRTDACRSVLLMCARARGGFVAGQIEKERDCNAWLWGLLSGCGSSGLQIVCVREMMIRSS